MANKKITELPAAAGVNLTDLLAKVNDPAGAAITQKATVSQLVTLLDTLYAKVGLVTTSGLTQNTARILGRTTAALGAIEELTSVPVTLGGTGTTTQFTAGSVIFAGASGIYTQDNAGLFYDNANDRLGIRTTGPTFPLHVVNNVNAGSGWPQISMENSSDYISGFSLRRSGGSEWLVYRYGSGGGDRLAIGQNGVSEPFVIDSGATGGVSIGFGIGTTPPASGLVVAGFTGICQVPPLDTVFHIDNPNAAALWALSITGGDDASTPTDPVNPAGWINCYIDNVDSWIPYYR